MLISCFPGLKNVNGSEIYIFIFVYFSNFTKEKLVELWQLVLAGMMCPQLLLCTDSLIVLLSYCYTEDALTPTRCLEVGCKAAYSVVPEARLSLMKGSEWIRRLAEKPMLAALREADLRTAAELNDSQHEPS